MCFKKNYEMRGLPEGFTVTFHAGAMDTEDNTLASLTVALEAKADVAELDVSFLPDGTAVLIHGDTPTDANLPRLEDALALTARYENTKLNLDLKNVSNLPVIDRLVEKYGLTERAFYTGVGEEWVETVKNNSRLPYYLNATLNPLKISDDAYIKSFAQKMRSLGVLGLNANYKTVNAKVVKLLQAEGFKVSLWTVNQEDEMKKVLSYAPDNITSRHPDKLRELLQN